MTMMWFWLAMGASVLSGFLYAFGRRLQATSLWIGKALVPTDSASAMRRGLQDAVMDGWPSWIGALLLPSIFAAAILGFMHSWWASILAFIMSIVMGILVGRFHLVPTTLEWYLAILYKHADRRAKNYRKNGDLPRADAAHQLAKELGEVLQEYRGSGVFAPTMMEEAMRSPHGDPHWLRSQPRQQ